MQWRLRKVILAFGLLTHLRHKNWKSKKLLRDSSIFFIQFIWDATVLKLHGSTLGFLATPLFLFLFGGLNQKGKHGHVHYYILMAAGDLKHLEDMRKPSLLFHVVLN